MVDAEEGFRLRPAPDQPDDEADEAVLAFLLCPDIRSGTRDDADEDAVEMVE